MKSIHPARLATRSFLTGLTCLACLSISATAQVQNFPVGSAARADDSIFLLRELGHVVDLDGDLLISGYSGAFGGGAFGGAVIFRREGTSWVFDSGADVPAAGSEDGGVAVAIDGNRIVVGAPSFADDIHEDVGVWEKQMSGWVFLGTLEHHLVAGFGRSVDISGDTVIVGATLSQRVYIFDYDGTSWTKQLETFVPTPVGGDLSALTGLGHSVAIEGDLAVAGAWAHPTEQLIVYRRSGSNWNVDQVLSIGDFGTLQADGFTIAGGSIALDGDTILTAALGPGPSTMTEPVICVLVDSGNGFEFDHAFAATDRVRADAFGGTISLDGDMAVIGAPRKAPDGAAYLFIRDPDTGIFEEQIKYTPTAPGSGAAGPNFGSAVAISNGTVAIGSETDTALQFKLGAVYVVGPKSFASSIQALCAGNDNQGPTCANCPCGNNADSDSLGGCLNSAGTSAILSMIGETRASADSMRLEVTRAQPSSFVVLFSGSNILPNNPGATGCVRASGVTSLSLDGLRCVGGGLARHGARTTNSSGNAGDTNDGWGGPFEPAGGLIAQGGFATGQNRYFQAIYRDSPINGCGTGLNTSNAIAAMVLP